MSIPTVYPDPKNDRMVAILGRALEEIGFVFLHFPAGDQLMAQTYPVFRQVFGLSPQIKHGYAHPEIFFQRGWTPPYTELGLACRRQGVATEHSADAKECWGMGPTPPTNTKFASFYPANIWPNEVPDLESSMTRLYDSLLAVAMLTFQMLEQYLGMKQGSFASLTNHAPHFMRALSYPAVTPEQVSNTQWACRHTDINFLTVLPASTKSGLRVRCHDGKWVSGRPDENCVIVQVADMLQHHTAGRFRSAVHEVRPPAEGTTEPRLSSALFVHARPEVRLNPYPQNNRFPTITAGDYLTKRLQAIGLASVPRY